MNKRKASNVTSIVKESDMIFEDDEDDSITGDSAKGSASREVSRVSGRAKKTKAIFDPSDNNGPVHKRKKEAVEAEKMRSLPTKKSAPKLVKSPVPSPKKTAALAAAFQILSPVKVDKVEPKLESPKVKTVAAVVKKRLSLDKKTVPDLIKTEVSTASVAKEPSKRIQARKQVKRPDYWNSAAADKKQRPSSSSAGGLSSDYDKASTVEFNDEGIPDVSRWTYQQVSQYFSNNLGFSKRDAAIFTDQEIDGEALKIMKRSDIVTTKFESLKLGTALKMWTHIIMFQTGSSDPTQAWK